MDRRRRMLRNGHSRLGKGNNARAQTQQKKDKMSEHPEATQYRELLNSMEFHESKKFEADDKKVALVDIDETICFYGEKRRYDMAIGHMANIAKINDLYDQGWKIIYWTARGGSKKSKKTGKCYYA